MSVVKLRHRVTVVIQIEGVKELAVLVKEFMALILDPTQQDDSGTNTSETDDLTNSVLRYFALIDHELSAEMQTLVEEIETNPIHAVLKRLLFEVLSEKIEQIASMESVENIMLFTPLDDALVATITKADD